MQLWALEARELSISLDLLGDHASELWMFFQCASQRAEQPWGREEDQATELLLFTMLGDHLRNFTCKSSGLTFTAATTMVIDAMTSAAPMGSLDARAWLRKGLGRTMTKVWIHQDSQLLQLARSHVDGGMAEEPCPETIRYDDQTWQAACLDGHGVYLFLEGSGRRTLRLETVENFAAPWICLRPIALLRSGLS